MRAHHKRHITVLGDLLLDRDVIGTVGRVCPDAPVPVLDVTCEHESPGGAGLAALQCRAHDIEVTLVAPLADDAEGRRLRVLLSESGIELLELGHEGRTRTKTRIRAAGQSLVRVDGGGPGRLVGEVTDDVRAALERADILLVSDYGAGMTHDPHLRELLSEVAKHAGPDHRLCWDPHPRGGQPVPGCAVVTPNLAEARASLADPTVSAAEGAGRLRSTWRAQGVAVTDGERGAWLATSASAPFFAAAPHVFEGDPCGAGDRFSASLAQSLARGALPSEAVVQAVHDASFWVAAGGAAGYRARASRPLERGPAGPGVAPLLTDIRGSGGRVVATGGCFDVLHAGHIASLQAAAALGDALVVLLNSDDSVRRLKGAGRPVHNVADRAAVLRALSCVDAVVVFDEDDPRGALRQLRPDVWAKGGDYAEDSLPEADLVRSWGGQVVLLPYLAGRSTTSILETIR